jgi:hypothetical protein
MLLFTYPYDFSRLYTSTQTPREIIVADHLNGFGSDGNNDVLWDLDRYAKQQGQILLVYTSYFLHKDLTDRYTNLRFGCDDFYGLPQFENYRTHPAIDFKNLVCSFNGAPQVGRKLLMALMRKFDLFDAKYCSKNFRIDQTQLSGYIQDYGDDRFYHKFFLSDSDTEFNDRIVSFGHNQYDHGRNIQTLERQLTESFVHLVSETVATSYVPFITEKFLYSIVTRGLFVTWAQPGWHQQLASFYGFRRYDRIFDYDFDNQAHPIQRLLDLVVMLSKFAILSPQDLHDLYLMEQDTVEFNYDHYFSRTYLRDLSVATAGQPWSHRKF